MGTGGGDWGWGTGGGLGVGDWGGGWGGESHSKPGTKMVDPESCKPQLVMAGIVPY